MPTFIQFLRSGNPILAQGALFHQMETTLRNLIQELDMVCSPWIPDNYHPWCEDLCDEGRWWQAIVFERSRSRLKRDGGSGKLFLGLPNSLVEEHILPWLIDLVEDPWFVPWERFQMLMKFLHVKKSWRSLWECLFGFVAL